MRAFPSITAIPPGGVTSPSPSTLVESLTTATVRPLQVWEKDTSTLSLMALETEETPGVYQASSQPWSTWSTRGMVIILPR